MNFISKIWSQLFLIERPSISLSFIRPIIALTTIFYIGPTLCHLGDNYFPTAFKTTDPSFLPLGLIELVQRSPNWVIVLFVWVFAVFSFFFLVGFLSQLSCIVMVLSCYYFQALNSFHIGSTLSWDILLVALFLFCLTPYHGDYFSVDCLLGGREDAYKRRRSYFLQRLLQLHVGFMYFYTALYKITAQGNWFTDNPLYYVLNYPSAGVTKYFILRDYLMNKPQLCYWLGVGIVVTELSMILLLFWRKTRVSAIYLSFFFHIILLLTLDVPAILFFVFPTLALLFINPDYIVDWIEQKRAANAKIGPMILIYDGDCGFCRKCVRILKVADLFGVLKFVDFRGIDDLSQLHPSLTKEAATKQAYLVEPSGKLFGGFFAFQKISLNLPMFYSLAPILYFPGMGLLGPVFYKIVSKNRFLFNKLLPN
ncbi:MAG TPA: DCC1-like thiol-disulfide oxidoreductase family protein [Candidatus Omnitrophota bacterium]|nr:DCC1-like thiol-disulfide oxidoreductase family protein [Candidatus Omnitrophota bacterium]